MAHSSSHYIRTIQTSFTVAHNGPWARPNAVPLNMPLYQMPIQKYHQAPIIHQQPALATPPASGAGGRRRAYAFRAPSPARAGGYKFDPFADEPTPVPSIATLASLSAPPTPRLAAASLPPPAHRPPPRRQNRGYYAGPQAPRTGMTSQRTRNTSNFIESADTPRYVQPNTEIWRSSPASIPRGRSLTYEFEEYDYEGAGSGATTPRRVSPPPPAPVQQQQQQVYRRTPSPPSPPARVSVNPQSANRFFNDKDAKAKLVAGILLNRVHAVGKPRRRVPSPVGAPKVYVPSSLSTVVACEA